MKNHIFSRKADKMRDIEYANKNKVRFFSTKSFNQLNE